MPAPAVLPALDFELLFEMLPAPHAVLAPDGTILGLNAAMTALLPAPAGLPGLPVGALRAAIDETGGLLADAATWHAALALALVGTPQVLTPVLQPTGPAAPGCYWQATLQPVPLGSPRYVLVRLLDVTEHLHSQAAALQEAEQFRFLAEHMPQLVWATSASGEPEFNNQRFIDYTGHDAVQLDEAARAALWSNIMHPDDLPAMYARWGEALSTGRPFDIEFRMRGTDGEYRWFLSHVMAQYDADGRVRRWFGACTDVENQYRLRHVLQTQYDELARAHHDLDTFVYAASHDLRQPSLNLRGLFDELRRSVRFDDPQAGQMLGMVDQALHELDGTLMDLAATVRTQRQQQEPTEAIDLELFVEEVLFGLNARLVQCQAQVELNLSEAPVLVYSRANLRSVLHNLLSNAIKFAHPDRPPRIVLRSFLTGNGTPALEVRDNGLGMNLENPANPVFRLFARQHAHIEGTGVGLYLVQRIVVSQGGHLAVHSTPGEGTAFTIYWAQSTT